MSAKRSSGGRATSWTRPGQRGSTPTAPRTMTTTMSPTNGPAEGVLRQDSRWSPLRRKPAPIRSNRVTLAYHRTVDVRPPEGQPTSEPSHPAGAETVTEGDERGGGHRPSASGTSFAARLIRFAGRPAVALVVIAVMAAVPRFWALGDPGTDKGGKRVYVFDETYYAKDACLYAGLPFKACGLTSAGEQSWVHPPLGKWVIAAGIKLFGNSPLGSRIPSAVFGTATVVLIALIALLLFQSVLWCYVAGILGAFEALLVVQSRVTLLDIFVAFWVVLGFLCVLLDRRYIDRRAARPAPRIEHRSAEPSLSIGPGAMARSEPTVRPGPPPEPEPEHAARAGG